MTEAEWLTCTDPRKMVMGLDPKKWDRKLRLFACACCRRVWHLMSEDRSRRVVEVAEQFADGQGDYNDLLVRAGLQPARRFPPGRQAPADCAAYAAAAWGSASYVDSAQQFLRAVSYAAEACAKAANETAGQPPHFTVLPVPTALTAEEAAQCELLREVIGPLLFRTPSVEDRYRTWDDGMIPRLAVSIYGETAFDRLPILSDALEEAGCDNGDILNHLRGPGPHVRGCWVVDLLLARG